MGAIKIQPGESLLSKELVQRYQNSTDPGVDLCSTYLLELFYNNYGGQKEKLLSMRNANRNEVNDFLTCEVTDIQLGFTDKRHPSRVFDRTGQYLDKIISYPYVMFGQSSDGKTIWVTMPLIKKHLTRDGKHLIVFNDCLLDHIDPDEDPVSISFSLLKEIKSENVVAGILYEEACRYKNWYNHGSPPFFNYTEKQLREKLLYDKIEVSEDQKSYITIQIKSMRIDKIRKKVLEPALKVLKDFFDQDKTEFWLDMKFFLTEAKKEGRPPKKNFHFTIHKEKDIERSASAGKAEEQELQFDDYEEITPLYYIKRELKIFVRKKALRELIIQQIEDGESSEPEFSKKVLQKIIEKKTALPYDEYKKGNYVLGTLRNEFGLGEESQKQPKEKLEDVPHWKEFSLDEKIQFMQGNTLLLDASATIGLSSDQTKGILSGEFREYCIKHTKPLEDWDDAYTLFFRWLNKITFSNKNSRNYENNGVNNADKRSKFDLMEEEIMRYYDNR